jgi:hypothetical protein
MAHSIDLQILFAFWAPRSHEGKNPGGFFNFPVLRSRVPGRGSGTGAGDPRCWAWLGTILCMISRFPGLTRSFTGVGFSPVSGQVGSGFMHDFPVPGGLPGVYWSRGFRHRGRVGSDCLFNC